jgi:aspartyl-tRNA(Asn)/glutamyl-tRNA(Gln) amidotransferase subunit C
VKRYTGIALKRLDPYAMENQLLPESEKGRYLPPGNRVLKEKVGYTLGRLEENMPDKRLKEEITPEVFWHLVDLAALDLEPDEAEYLRMELNKQLRAIHELRAIPLDPDTPTASHGVPYTPEISPPMRDDEWQPDSNPEAIIAQAPQAEDGYIIVPEIPHTELD